MSQESVDVALIESGHIPVKSESQDIIYCISVLEHIPNFEPVIDEMFRVLKPDGQLILTVDIDLRGNCELGVNKFKRLQTKLNDHFSKEFPERTLHPCNLLTTSNSPYHIKSRSLLFPIKQLIKGALQGTLLNGDPRVGVFLGIYASIIAKR